MDATARRRPGIASERAFFFWMAFAMLATVFIGFSATWFLRPWLVPPGFLPLTPLVWLHGLLFTCWAALFMTQVSLVAAGRRDLHMKLGIAGMGFAIALPVVGILASLTGALRAAGPPGIPPMSFLAVPLLSVLAFTPLLIAGLRNRRNPAAHKRLMLLAMIIFTAPGFGRIPIFPGPTGFMLAPLIFVSALWIWDMRALGRVHRATLWGSAVVVASLLLPFAIGFTRPWLAFAHWATGLAAQFS
jgi:uncharacterized membrane protein